MSNLVMAIFRSSNGNMAVLVGDAEYPEALAELVVERYYGSRHVSPNLGIDMGDSERPVYDGERVYDADSYEPGELLGFVRVVPVADGTYVQM